MIEQNNNEYTFEEISEALSMSPSKCRQTLLVALKKLKMSNIEKKQLGNTKESQIKIVEKYLKNKYQNRYTLKIQQIADELLISKDRVKELRDTGIISSFSTRKIATFIVNNPPKKIKSDSISKAI